MILVNVNRMSFGNAQQSEMYKPAHKITSKNGGTRHLVVVISPKNISPGLGKKSESSKRKTVFKFKKKADMPLKCTVFLSQH